MILASNKRLMLSGFLASSIAYTNEVIYTVLLKTSDCSRPSISRIFSQLSTCFLSLSKMRDQTSKQATKRAIERAHQGFEKGGENWVGGEREGRGGAEKRKRKKKGKKRKEKKRLTPSNYSIFCALF